MILVIIETGIQMYMWNLYNVINQSYFNEKKNEECVSQAHRKYVHISGKEYCSHRWSHRAWCISKKKHKCLVEMGH